MSNSLFISAAKGEKTKRPPIWMMRQAGRYCPEYRAIKEKHTFQEMVYTPSLATEVTLQPLARFGMDAAILFSDILVTAEALGGDLSFIEKKGPVFSNPIQSRENLDQVIKPNFEKLSPIFEAIKQIKNSTTTPLIGFAGAPFTVASYLIEGQSNPSLSKTKAMMCNDPATLDTLVKYFEDITVDYLNEQLNAGVDALQIFDTWAGQLSKDAFMTYVQTPIKNILSRLDNSRNVPVSLFCKNTTTFAPYLIDCGANVLSVDWQTDLKAMKRSLPAPMAIQGNLDPEYLFHSPSFLEKEVKRILEEMKDEPGFIFNLGHGIMPKTPVENVKLVVDLVQGN